MSLSADKNIKISPQGYQINNAPKNSNPFWGQTPVTDSYVEEIYLTQKDDDFYLSAKMGTGETVEIGNWPAGGSGSSEVVVKSITLTNENGTYTFTAHMTDGQDVTIGTLEIPEQPNIDNLIAEVNDSIVENTTDGYDYHAITETENNGTRNNVGSFYLSQKQITKLEKTDTGLTVHTVDQKGVTSSEDIPMSGGGGGTKLNSTWGSKSVYFSIQNQGGTDMVEGRRYVAICRVQADISGTYLGIPNSATTVQGVAEGYVAPLSDADEIEIEMSGLIVVGHYQIQIGLSISGICGKSDTETYLSVTYHYLSEPTDLNDLNFKEFKDGNTLYIIT